MNRPRNPEFEPPSAEKLNEKDRNLNMLSRQFEQITNALNTNSYRLIKLADSEIPDEPAEVRTEILSQVKDQLEALRQIVLKVETIEGIIDINQEQKRLGE